MLNKPLSLSRTTLWALYFITLLLLGWQAAFLNLDPDLGWHLKIGQDIAIGKQLPHDQIHLWTIQGEWVDHEWLTNALMWLTYQASGYVGLSFVFAFIIALTCYLIARHLQSDTWPADIFIATIIGLGFWGLIPHLGPRPQFISFLFLVILIVTLKKIGPTINWRQGIWLAVFFWLWASLHAGFLIGLAVLIFWTTQKLYEERKQTKSLLTAPLFVFLACLIAVFATPYGPKLFSFLGTYSSTAYLSLIKEWKAQWVFPLLYSQLFFIALSIGLTIVWLIFDRPRKNLLWGQVACLMFLIMSLKSVRHFPLFFACFSLIVLPDFIKKNFHFQPPAQHLKKTKKILLIALTIGLLIFNWRLLLSINFFQDPFKNFCHRYPCQTTQLLRDQSRYNQLTLLNHYNYGGWLIWVWPEKKLFIDGRLPQYPFNNHTLIEEYIAFTDPNQLAGQLASHDIEIILWPKHILSYQLNWLDRLIGFRESEINNRQDELKKYLESSPNWRLLLSDQASVVYVRQDKY